VQCPKCDHSVPEGKNKCLYCGTVVDDVGSFAQGATWVDSGSQDWRLKVKGLSDEDVLLTFGLKKTKKKLPMSKAVLMLIFMSSFVLGGLVVWLLR